MVNIVIQRVNHGIISKVHASRYINGIYEGDVRSPFDSLASAKKWLKKQGYKFSIA